MELKSCYWELFESNQCSGDSLAVLIQSANWDLDNYRNEMQSWEWLKSHYDEDLNMILFKIRQWPIIGSYARNYLYNFIAYFYDLYSTYIEGLQKAEQRFLEEKEIDNKMIEEILIEVNDTNKREAEKVRIYK